MRKSEHKIRRVASGRLAVDSSSVNGGNVSDTNGGNFVGNPTHCRTRLRHTAEGRKIRHEGKVDAGTWVVLENFKQFVLDNDRQFVFQTDTKRGRHG